MKRIFITSVFAIVSIAAFSQSLQPGLQPAQYSQSQVDSGASIMVKVPANLSNQLVSKATLLNQNLAYFQYGVGVDAQTELPYDHITLNSTNTAIASQGEFVTPSEIGLYLDLLVAIEKGKLPNSYITPIQAQTRMFNTLETVGNLPTCNGLFYWYNFSGSSVTPQPGDVASAVDNGNMAFALAGVVGALENSKNPVDIKNCAMANAILIKEEPGWSQLYDPQNGLLWAGFPNGVGQACHYWIDRTYNESRTSTIWAILCTQKLPAGEQVPISAFSNMGRYYNSYSINGQNEQVLMTWDGGTFQAFLPSLFIDESKYSPLLKTQDYYFFTAQQEFCTTNGLPALLSASSTIDNGYDTFGVPQLSEGYVKYGNAANYSNGSPYATGVAGAVFNQQATTMLQTLEQKYPQIVSPFGFLDAINSQGETCNTIIALDQEMLILGLLGNENSRDVAHYLHTNHYTNELKSIYNSIN